MGLKVRLSRQARSDLAAIRSNLLANADTRAADRVRAHLRDKIMRLGNRPSIGVASSHPRIRILAATRYSFLIYYTVTETSVVVLHIRHTSRANPDLDDLV